MDKYYVLVAGNGETSRANLEALMEDHYYANGADGTLVIAYKTKPTQSQIFAVQYSLDRKKEVLIYATEAASFAGFGSSDVVLSDTPLEDSVKLLKGEKASVFLLWSDEDPDCTDILSAAKDIGAPVFDLTDGLNPIDPAEGITPVVKTVFPVQEVETPIEEEDDEEEYEDEEEEEDPQEDSDEDDEEEDDGETSSDIYFGVKAIAELVAPIFAKAFVEAMKNSPKEGKA